MDGETHVSTSTDQATQDDELRQLDATFSDLAQEYAGRVSLGELRLRFDAVVAEFGAAPVRTFVPVLARRSLRQSLSSLP